MTSKPDSPDQKPSFIEAVRRAQITECAIQCIAEIGYVNASLAKIAKRADISTGVISYHFASKDDLIRAVIAHVMDTAIAFIEPRVDFSNPRAALRTGIEATVSHFATNRDYSLALLKINLAGGTGTPTEPYDPEIQERRQGRVREILAQGQEDGSFRKFDINVMVAAIFGAFDTVPRKVVADPPVDLAAYGRELAELFDRATRAD